MQQSFHELHLVELRRAYSRLQAGICLFSLCWSMSRAHPGMRTPTRTQDPPQPKLNSASTQVRLHIVSNNRNPRLTIRSEFLVIETTYDSLEERATRLAYDLGLGTCRYLECGNEGPWAKGQGVM